MGIEGIVIKVGIEIDGGGPASMTLYEDMLQIPKLSHGDMISLIAILRDAADALDTALARSTH